MSKTLILTGAHPDDETFGMGGTLAQYAAAGVKVYYVCATRGEAGIDDPADLEGYSSAGDKRWAELTCASRILGLTEVIYLGYRDSGMPGWPDNKHPQALMVASLEEVTGKIVKIFRKLKPNVVVTSDPIGGYHHPDHIAIHKATIQAFSDAADPTLYPETGPAFQPLKLYYSIFPRGMLKIAVRFMPLLGVNPHKFGRNQDIDLTAVADVNYPVHAVIRLSRESIETMHKATACHTRPLGGKPPGGGLLGWIERWRGQTNLFMRAYPPFKGRKEKDLFQGIE